MAEAVVRLLWPLAQRMPETDREVEEAMPKIGVIKVGEVCRTFKPVPVLPVTYKAPPEVDCTEPAVREERVVEPVTPKVPLTPKVKLGEEEAMPTFPAWVTVSNWVPVEEAMAKGLVPPLPWTKRVVVGVMVPMPTRSVEVAL